MVPVFIRPLLEIVLSRCRDCSRNHNSITDASMCYGPQAYGGLGCTISMLKSIRSSNPKEFLRSDPLLFCLHVGKSIRYNIKIYKVYETSKYVFPNILVFHNFKASCLMCIPEKCSKSVAEWSKLLACGALMNMWQRGMQLNLSEIATPLAILQRYLSYTISCTRIHNKFH